MYDQRPAMLYRKTIDFVSKIKYPKSVTYEKKCAVVLCNQMYGVTEHGEAIHSKHKRLKLGGGQAYDRSTDKLPFRSGEIN
jgi:hypothetical protein